MKEKRKVVIMRHKEGKPLAFTKKLGRNELCHCGSGKKYKVCHMVSDEKTLWGIKKGGE